MTGYGARLFALHVKLLEASAISPDVARARGYVSVDTGTRLESAGFAKSQRRNVPGLLIPLHGADGTLRLHQYRPDNPRVGKDGRPRKYETPFGSTLCVDVPPGALPLIDDPTVPLWITEGARKADAAVTAGLCCVALLGVEGWQSKGVALPDWKDIRLRGREAVVAFDSDVMTKPSVADALNRRTVWLDYRGARVRHVILPDGSDGAKTGLDDYLADGHDAAELRALARDASIATATATPRKTTHTRTPPADQPKQVCAPDGVCAHTPELASADDLLGATVETVHALGVSGEERLIRGTYLTAVSQMLAEPVSLVVKGSSAGGKSYSTRTTLRLCPEEDFYAVTAGSQRSLIYTDEDFEHRTIVMYEATALREIAEQRDGDMTAMLVRTLLSEGRIIYDVAERGDDGKTAVRRITKHGPTSLIITTTADNLHHENETRLLSLTVDESEEQTRAVMVKIARRRNQLVPPEPPDLAPWHALFHWLKHHGEHRVFIPYAEYLSGSAAASAIRMRRDFSVLLGMIEASAVLHQASRKRDDYGRIIAADSDYDSARDILAEAFAISSGRTVKESVRRAVTAVAELGGGDLDVTVAQVARHIRRDRTRVTRGLREAADLGYLTNRESKPGRAARYRTGPDALPDDRPALPDVLPDDTEDERTPAQGAHVSLQVSDGCAGVRVCAGDGGENTETLAVLCTCGLVLPDFYADYGWTHHGGCEPPGGLECFCETCIEPQKGKS
jgi:hypothetical protein